jgi:hypothetical protein
MEVMALADTGALMLRIPEHVGVQLQLEQESLREVTVADGRVMQVPGVGPVRVADQGRSCFLGHWCWGIRCGLVSCPDKTPALKAANASRSDGQTLKYHPQKNLGAWRMMFLCPIILAFK